jgi:hypothetical protein
MKLTHRQRQAIRELAALAPRCHGKRIYATRADAAAAGANRVGKGAQKLRVYRCPECKGFHLTKRAGGGRV